MWTSFNTGVPTGLKLICIDGIGYATFEFHYEDGRIMVYIGNGRRMIISGNYRWRYCN